MRSGSRDDTGERVPTRNVGMLAPTSAAATAASPMPFAASQRPEGPRLVPTYHLHEDGRSRERRAPRRRSARMVTTGTVLHVAAPEVDVDGTESGARRVRRVRLVCAATQVNEPRQEDARSATATGRSSPSCSRMRATSAGAPADGDEARRVARDDLVEHERDRHDRPQDDERPRDPRAPRRITAGSPSGYPGAAARAAPRPARRPGGAIEPERDDVGRPTACTR